MTVIQNPIRIEYAVLNMDEGTFTGSDPENLIFKVRPLLSSDVRSSGRMPTLPFSLMGAHRTGDKP